MTHPGTERETRRPATRAATVVLLVLFVGFMAREAVVGGCVVGLSIPSGHVPSPVSSR